MTDEFLQKKNRLHRNYFKLNFFNRPDFCLNKKYIYKKYEARVLYFIFCINFLFKKIGK
jgi:hypothetical protein